MYFTSETFDFLRDLSSNNDREWFKENRDRYEESVRIPALRFVSDFAPELAAISSRFVADPRPNGRSLFRIHRDIRFSADKSPYKTHLGIRFFHEGAGDVYTPGFYLGIEPGRTMAGIGIWRPDSSALHTIRQAMVDDPDAWREAAASLGGGFSLWGESLVRAPKGYDSDHPLIEDLKRKDFVGMTALEDEAVISADFVNRYTELCRGGAPFVRYLCEVMAIPF